MAERFTRLFTLENALVSPGAPVMVAAAALLRDSYSSHLMAQLKLRSLDARPIRSVKVHLSLLDASGAPLGKAAEFVYQDLAVKQDEEFGKNTAVVLSNAAARSFSVRVTEVLFSDGGRWNGEGAGWLPIAPRRTLEEGLGDRELAVQYQVRYGADCLYYPSEEAGIWYCACGAVNLSGERRCHKCRRSLSAMREVDLDDLRAQCAGRLKNEAEQKIQDRAEASQKGKKWLKTAAIAIPLLILLTGVLLTVPGAVANMRGYNEAEALLDANRFRDAAEAFQALGSYSDSAERAEKYVPYRRALYIMELAAQGETESLSFIGKSEDDLSEEFGAYGAAALLYQAADEIFTSLGGYRDCSILSRRCGEAIEDCRAKKLSDDYDGAKALLEEKEYSLAAAAFQALGEYEDSAQLRQEALYRKAVALYGFTEKYSVRNICAQLQTDPGLPSRFSLLRGDALKLGGQCITDLRSACGGDEAEIDLYDAHPAEFVPFLDALSTLFASLDGYRDSEAYLEKLADAADYSRDFFLLLEAGDLAGASGWLAENDFDFEDRGRWEELVALYLPLCADWALHMGDLSLLPYSIGVTASCLNLRSQVILSQDSAVLRLTFEAEDGEHTAELSAPLGETIFYSQADGSGSGYYAVLNGAGRLAYIQYGAAGSATGSCEYDRAEAPEETGSPDAAEVPDAAEAPEEPEPADGAGNAPV